MIIPQANSPAAAGCRCLTCASSRRLASQRAAARLLVWALASLSVLPPARAQGDERTNWICGGQRPWAGVFELTESVVYPWTGVDEDGSLRKAVALPSCHPFITKSNQFSYAWLGTSASFVDLDADSLPDLVSPDGNGMVWFWKNTGSPGMPTFAAGEVMPMLLDDLRSQFAPIFGDAGAAKTTSGQTSQLSPAQQAEKRRVDERREREFQRLKRKNDRAPNNRKRDEKELRKEVEDMFPYDWEKGDPRERPEDSDATPAGRVLPNAKIPPGGLSCTLNTFRRLRLVLTPTDWNADGAPDFLGGDSGGTVYFAPNSGRPGRPQFGYSTRLTHALPLKVVRLADSPGRQTVYEAVPFMNYAMPFACDWDGDGVPDLLVGEGTYSVNTVRLFPSAARATMQSPPKEIALYVGEERTFLAPFAYDWDADGDLDLFVCDSTGRLTMHRRTGSPPPPTPTQPQPSAYQPAAAMATFHPVSAAGSGSSLDPPVDMTLDGGNAPLAYCTPQPCDWNADGIMDLVWGEPFGRIMVALGKEKGGTTFSTPEVVRSTITPDKVEMPASDGVGRTISLAAVPARVKDAYGGQRHGGTADARRFYLPDGTRQENLGGWPNSDNKAFYGLMPSWSAVMPPRLEEQLQGDNAGQAHRKHASWGIAPIPGDVWEVVEETGAPGRGRTLLLRWHDPSHNAVFKSLTTAPPQWTQGVAIYFHPGRPDPFAHSYTKKPITIKFHMRLDGDFTRLDVHFGTNWGPLVKDKPPVEGGDILSTMVSLPRRQWFEFTHTEEPHDEYERGLDGSLSIQLLGRGEVRLRDVRVFEGN